MMRVCRLRIANKLAALGARHVFMLTGGRGVHALLNDRLRFSARTISIRLCQTTNRPARLLRSLRSKTVLPAIVNSLQAGMESLRSMASLWGRMTIPFPMLVVSGQVKRRKTLRKISLQTNVPLIAAPESAIKKPHCDGFAPTYHQISVWVAPESLLDR